MAAVRRGGVKAEILRAPSSGALRMTRKLQESGKRGLRSSAPRCLVGRKQDAPAGKLPALQKKRTDSLDYARGEFRLSY